MKNVQLPYIDNAKAVLVTVAINLGVVFVFNWRSDGVNFQDVLWDSLICAVITTLINMWIVFSGLKKLRAAGQMPLQAPVSSFMQRLPQHPFALGIVCAVVFAALTVGVNALIIWFFDLQTMTFAPWMVYKLIYATVLSIKIVEFCIFRYVQPDWANSKHVAPHSRAASQRQHNVIANCGEQTATSPRTDGEAASETAPAMQAIKNPLPKISVFKEMYGSVTGNIALNIIIGSILGGAVTRADGSVVIFPTTVEGIPISGLIFGCITGILLTNGVLKAMKAVIITSGSAILETATRNRWLTWMPKRKGLLVCLITCSIMIFSAVALPAIMHLFGKAFLNFFQFSIFITVYASMICKPLSYVLVKRCMQEDYIKQMLNK